MWNLCLGISKLLSTECVTSMCVEKQRCKGVNPGTSSYVYKERPKIILQVRLAMQVGGEMLVEYCLGNSLILVYFSGFKSTSVRSRCSKLHACQHVLVHQPMTEDMQNRPCFRLITPRDHGYALCFLASMNCETSLTRPPNATCRVQSGPKTTPFVAKRWQDGRSWSQC